MVLSQERHGSRVSSLFAVKQIYSNILCHTEPSVYLLLEIRLTACRTQASSPPLHLSHTSLWASRASHGNGSRHEQTVYFHVCGHALGTELYQSMRMPRSFDLKMRNECIPCYSYARNSRAILCYCNPVFIVSLPRNVYLFIAICLIP